MRNTDNGDRNGYRTDTQPFRKTALQRFSLALIFVALTRHHASVAEDQTQLALSGLEFGGSMGKLLWVSVQVRDNVSRSDADRYSRLASEIREQIELGRASSAVVKAKFDLLATSLAYATVVDPEPVSKAVAGVAAWAAKKTGDAVGGLVLEESQKQAKAILAQGLKNRGLTPSQLRKITAGELGERVADLKVGGQKLRDILQDQPASLSMLQAHAVDIATDIGVEALSRAEGTAADVRVIQQNLADTNKKIDEYQKEVRERLTKIETRVSGLVAATQTANEAPQFAQ